MKRFLYGYTVVIILAICLAGCVNTGPVYEVSGVVTYKNHDLGIADVTIYYEGEKTGTATTRHDGSYTLRNLRGPKVIRAKKAEWSFETTHPVTTSSENIDFVGTYDHNSTAYLLGTVNTTHNFPNSALDPKSNEENTRPKRPFTISSLQQASSEDNEDEVVIVFHSSTTSSQQHQVLASLGMKILDQAQVINAYLVRLPHQTAEHMITGFSTGIRYVEKNQVMQPFALKSPNDPLYGSQWHLPLIRLPQAWAQTTGEKSVRIAVLDTGVDLKHPDLLANLDTDYAYNFVDDNDDVQDLSGHGTHVAGILGAVSNNSQGIAGVMWDVSILPIKVMNENGGTSWDVTQGILYAAGLLNQPGEEPYNPSPAAIINLSLGGRKTQHMQDAVNSATAAGVVLVSAAGNDSSPEVLYPAAFSDVIAVGAVDYNYPNKPNLAPYSNYGTDIDLVAPGGDLGVDSDRDGDKDGILSTRPDGQYAFMQGTSMAAPQVSGIIGLMLASNIPFYQVREILQQTSMPLGEDGDLYYGHGLINAYWAINQVDKVRVLVGTRVGDEIDAVAETQLDLDCSEYHLSAIPPGNHQVFAWIDVRNNNIIEPGDYFAELGMLEFQANEVYSVSGVIVEID